MVTSYSANKNIQNEVTKAGIKMLPKELASAANIIVDKRVEKWSNHVDMVWVEDQDWLVNDLVNRYYNHLKVDTYYDPISFMDSVEQYPLDTRIILDTYYESPDKIPYTIDGFSIAKELHNKGYTKLILYAGEQPTGIIPEYLTIVLKSDRSSTAHLDKI